MTDDLTRFYNLLGVLAARPEQGKPLSHYTGRVVFPARGVYFFIEPGEYRASNPTARRVVRVGTHAVSANSKSKLWGRLRTHRGGSEGGGNHRGSVFRLHVGSALLQRDRELIGLIPTWSVGQSASREIRASEAEHERRVSSYIGAMSVFWVGVPDEAGRDSLRSYIERNAIALLSNQLLPVDPPSPSWLGLHSVKRDIRESGLWNLNYVSDVYEPAFLEVLNRFVDQTK